MRGSGNKEPLCAAVAYNTLIRIGITNIIGIIKVHFMAEQLYWIALHCTNVPKKVAQLSVSELVSPPN